MAKTGDFSTVSDHRIHTAVREGFDHIHPVWQFYCEL